MSRASAQPLSIVARRMKALREELGWSQERVGVAIGIDESSARARISRYELGVHEPPVPTVRLIAKALGVPMTFMYCEEDNVAELLRALYRLNVPERNRRVQECLGLAKGQQR